MAVTPLPNWVDLLVVIIVFQASYNGFGRGIATELLYGGAAVLVTVLTVNYWPKAMAWLRGWVALQPNVLAPLVFWLGFLAVWTIVRFLVRRLADFMKWDRLHWILQSAGLVLGGLRGAWWAGLITLTLATSGFERLRTSVEERSVLGPRLTQLFRTAVIAVSDRTPGAADRAPQLVPPLRGPSTSS